MRATVRTLAALLLVFNAVEAFMLAPSSKLFTSRGRRESPRSFPHTVPSTGRAAEIRRRQLHVERSIKRRMVDGDNEMGEERRGEKQSVDAEEDNPGYTQVTVREAVEWTMSSSSEFSYLDVRSAEEHEKLAIPRGALCMPAFERATPLPAQVELNDDDVNDSAPTSAEDDNFEAVEWKVLPDFVDRVKAEFDLDAKLLVGCKTNRSSQACKLLVEAGFTEIFNVESQIFMRTRAPQVWE